MPEIKTGNETEISFKTRVFLGNGGNYMLYCDEYDKDCSEVTSEECDNGCCDSCMYCVVCPDEGILY